MPPAVQIADSMRWVGDSISAVSVPRLCSSARVALGQPETFTALDSTDDVDALWSRQCCIAESAGGRRLVAPLRGAGLQPEESPNVVCVADHARGVREQ
jgi:hypothetical protein